MQRVINKVFIAENILTTDAQAPVIAANHPAQVFYPFNVFKNKLFLFTMGLILATSIM